MPFLQHLFVPVPGSIRILFLSTIAGGFKRIEKTLKHPAIFDGRNVYSLEKMETQPFYYESIGRRILHDKIRFEVEHTTERLVRDRGGLD